MCNVRLRINRLHIKAVRGIPDLLLQLDGKGLILSGPNGSGKSSVVDACEFLLLGSIGHLEGKQTLSLSKHGKHVHAQPSDMAVEFILSGNRTMARKLGAGAVCVPEAARYLEAAQSRAFLLRRSQLLAFIHADPADRFRSLASLIGIEQLDELELTFKRVHDGLEGEVRSQLAQLGERRRELQTLSGLGADKLDKDSLLEVVNTSLALVQRPAIATLDDYAGLSAALGGSEQAEATARKLIALEEVVPRLGAAEAGVRVLADAAGLAVRVTEFVANQDSRKALASRDVLAASENYLSTYSPKQCPVCDQLIEADVVLAALKNKLQVLRELSERASTLRVDASAIAADLTALAQTIHELRPSVTGDLLDVLSAAEDQASTFAKGFRSAHLLEEPFPWPARSADDDRRFVDALRRSRTANTQAMEQLRPSDHERRLAETITKVVRIQQAFVQTTALAIALNRQMKHLARAAAAAGAIVAAKNDVVAEIFARLKADIDRFYELLHPGEDHSNITLAG